MTENDDVATLRQVASELEVSAARVHQIERNALDKLRDAAIENG